MPSDFMISIWRWIKGRLHMGRSGLGRLSLNGAIRVPRPAARITPMYLLMFIRLEPRDIVVEIRQVHGAQSHDFLPVVLKGTGQAFLPDDGSRNANEGI